jgi:uncharacterized phage protein gp47/JayE
MATTTNDYPTVESIVERYLNFVYQHLVRNGVASASAKAGIGKGTDRWMTAMATAQGIVVNLANARALEDATMPDTAIGEDLDRLCAIYGLTRSTGAGAQGDVTVDGSGTMTFAAGAELVGNKNKKRYKVVSPISVTDGDPIAIVGIDTGKSTNLDAGEVLTWTSPPAGCSTTCVVASGGLTNGKDADTDARLRTRLLKLLQQPQNGGSWAHYRQWAEDSSAAVENAFVFPAYRGPGTVSIAYTIEGNRDNDYARAGSAALTAVVQDAVVSQQPEFADAFVTSVEHEDLALALKLTLPEPAVAGGEGGGWIDESADRWAIAKRTAGNSDGVVAITAKASSTTFTTDAYNEPVEGSTVCFFSATDRTVYTAKVKTSVSGSAGAWVFTIDKALSSLLVGDYIFPACEKASDYAEAIMTHIATLAPGEKTSDADVLPRAKRHPKATQGAPSAVTTTLLAGLQTAYPKVTNAAFFYLNGLSPTLPLEPSVPAFSTDPPNIWRVLRLALYPTS